MSNANTPPYGGTDAVPITSLASEGELLYQIAKNIVCPECGENIPIHLIRFISPENTAKETAETYKRGLGGAAGCGAVGAIFGPPGVVGGLVVGALLGGTNGRKQDLKKQMDVTCTCCAYEGCPA